MLAEVCDLLAPVADGWIVDCTVGLGGHTEALLERFSAARILGIDRDPRALELAGERLARFGSRVRFLEGRFSDVQRLCLAADIERPRGVLADLGVSSMQLEIAERGFSFMYDGPLDMRMSGGEQGDVMTAQEVLQNYSEEELRRLMRIYGEERYARQIARAIVNRRTTRPLETTGELRQLIEEVKPSANWSRGKRRGRGQKTTHPATQTFQALRMEVNEELGELRQLLDDSTQMLDQDGRLVVISYHSGEDRMVKHTLRDLAAGEIEPVTGRTRAETQVIEVLTKKVVRPSEAEVERNPRSRSARLRAARRL